MAEKHPKRPRDMNEWAKRMVDIATGTVEDGKTANRKPTPRGATPSKKPSRQTGKAS